MASASARMLKLLSLLQTHRHWSGGELSERLAVSERTLRRDVERLRELGYPVHAVRGVAGGYQLKPGAVLPPLLLDDEEAVAIVVGLRAAAGGMVAGIEETSVRALGKIVSVMPPRLRRRVSALDAFSVPAVLSGVAGSGPRIDPSTLAVLAQACRDDERLRFGYTARSQEATARTVEPHRLVCVGRRWYLVAWDLSRHDWRSFRVDRLTDPVTTGARFRQRELPGGDAAEFVKSGIRTTPQRHHVAVRVEAPAAQVQEYVGSWGAAQPVSAEGCRLTMEVDDLEWPLMVLAGVGAGFTVEEPPELVDLLRRVGRLFTAATGA